MEATIEAVKKASRWLNQFEKDVYSQNGEDGVIRRVLDILPSRDRWCVELGAWDGKHLSNTYHLVEKSAYNVVLIEGSKARYDSLCCDYPYKDHAVFVNQFVGWGSADNLDAILDKKSIPLDFDLLSIDIDGK
jgi:hypothetical protein